VYAGYLDLNSRPFTYESVALTRSYTTSQREFDSID